MVLLFLLTGLILLIAGAELLVRGVSSLSKKLGLSSLIIGLTVVAFGTSIPELLINIYSVYQGAVDITIGNIIGSNISNILLILGVAAAIQPLKVKKSTVWKEIPFAFLAILLVSFMANDAIIEKNPINAVTRIEGLTLISLFAIFLIYIFSNRKHQSKHTETNFYSIPVSSFMMIGGFAALFLGGKIFVDNAIEIARFFQLSERIIGLTVVAIGTSLPELVTSIVAVIEKEDDIAVGNIVGSNIFNTFWILGLTSTISPLPFNPLFNIDLWVCLSATMLLFFYMFMGHKHRLDRWQGVSFVIFYILYLWYICIFL